MKDMHSNIKAVSAIVPAVKTDAADGTTVDLRGYNSVALVINTGAIAGDGDFGIVVQDSVNGSSWGAAAATDVLGTVPASLEADSAYHLSYVGSKRYVRVNITKGGGTSIALGAVAILGNPHIAPVA